MKKLYFSLVTFLFFAVANAQIVNIPDPVFKASLLAANSSNDFASVEIPNSNGNVTNYTVIDTNADGEIQISEAIAIKYLNIRFSNIYSMEGISSFSNLQYLGCEYNQLTSLNVSGLTYLRYLSCYDNQLTNLDASGLANLQSLSCSNNQLTNLNVSGLTNLQSLSCFSNQLTNLNVSGLTNLQSLSCFSNILMSLNISGLTNLQYLNCEFNQLSNLNVSGLTNLLSLNCHDNQLTNIDVNDLTNLQYLNCEYNQLSSLNISGLTNLQSLSCYSNQLTNLNVSGLTNLQSLSCYNNQLTNLNVSGLTNLQSLSCFNNLLMSLNIDGLTNLHILNCLANQLTSLDVSGLNNLQYLYCYNNQLTSLNVNGLTNLLRLECNNNQFTTLDVSGLTNLQSLDCSYNQLASFNTNGLTNLQRLECNNNQFTTLDLSNLTNLEDLNCRNNQLTSINVSGLTNLQSLNCYANQLTSLNVNGLTNLQSLFCYNNQLVSLNLSDLTNLQRLECNNNQLTTLDVITTKLNNLDCRNNQLISLFIKNGFTTSWTDLNINGNPDLIYICADEEDLTYVQNKINQYGYSATCQANSYCSFTPGGTFYTIKGDNKIDTDNNGCDTNDSIYQNLKYNITNGLVSGSLISNSSGNYNIPVQAGTHTITPQLENPTYFTASPTSAIVTFPATTSPSIQDFCIVPNGAHHDLEVVVIPLDVARPGFDASYKIKYKNKGNQIENATINFNYNDAILDYVSSSVTPTTQTTGTLSWNVGMFAPFQSGEYVVALNLNSPTETPPVNNGYVLNYTASVNGLNTDETPDDNTFALRQEVVNSFDPNDKTCLEGSTINPSMIGKYVHYKIRFENTGTFAAQNIVVKDMIDTTKFDLATLQMTDASHSCVTRITNPNKVEFIFENINLPFDDTSNDGYVVFKIKTKPTLVVGSTISNSANIYFDYNFPIVTNTATSTFSVLQNDAFEFDNYFTINPNPVYEVLNLTSKQDTEIYSLTIYNLLGQQIQTIAKPNSKIDVSSLNTGSYIVKVITDKGILSSNFLKK